MFMAPCPDGDVIDITAEYCKRREERRDDCRQGAAGQVPPFQKYRARTARGEGTPSRWHEAFK